jgi:hypothetical protein
MDATSIQIQSVDEHRMEVVSPAFYSQYHGIGRNFVVPVKKINLLTQYGV